MEMQRPDYPAAREAWRRFIAVQPEEPVGWLGLREACRLMGDSRAANLADARLQQLNDRLPAPVRRPREFSATSKSGLIFALTIGFLVIVFLSFRTVWLAFNQRNLRIKPLEDRPSS